MASSQPDLRASPDAVSRWYGRVCSRPVKENRNSHANGNRSRVLRDAEIDPVTRGKSGWPITMIRAIFSNIFFHDRFLSKKIRFHFNHTATNKSRFIP
jgi:hypothetical protein